jgi:hypothetical protein
MELSYFKQLRGVTEVLEKGSQRRVSIFWVRNPRWRGLRSYECALLSCSPFQISPRPSLGCDRQSISKFGRVFGGCHAQKSPFCGFHQLEIGSRHDGKKSKGSRWHQREAEYPRKRAEREVNSDRHNCKTCCYQGGAWTAGQWIPCQEAELVSRPESSSCLGVENGFVTVTPFHVKPSCKSSERRRRQPASAAAESITESQILS